MYEIVQLIFTQCTKTLFRTEANSNPGMVDFIIPQDFTLLQP